MHRSWRFADFPWEGISLDLLLVVLWTWALPPTMGWFLRFPHLAAWGVSMLQVVTVGRMVALYLQRARTEPRILGRWSQPLGMLAAILSVGAFIWLLGAMVSSQVQWGFFTLRLPLLVVFATFVVLAVNVGLSAEGPRTRTTRLVDAALVIGYLFAAEAFLFAMLDGAGPAHRSGMVVALLLCHFPMRLVFALVPPTSRYELGSAALCLAYLLWDVLVGG